MACFAVTVRSHTLHCLCSVQLCKAVPLPVIAVPLLGLARPYFALPLLHFALPLQCSVLPGRASRGRALAQPRPASPLLHGASLSSAFAMRGPARPRLRRADQPNALAADRCARPLLRPAMQHTASAWPCFSVPLPGRSVPGSAVALRGAVSRCLASAALGGAQRCPAMPLPCIAEGRSAVAMHRRAPPRLCCAVPCSTPPLPCIPRFAFAATSPAQPCTALAKSRIASHGPSPCPTLFGRAFASPGAVVQSCTFAARCVTNRCRAFTMHCGSPRSRATPLQLLNNIHRVAEPALSAVTPLPQSSELAVVEPLFQRIE